MQACLERARLAARTDLPVLILGESGTGKTILARAIYNSSARAGGPFVSFNAAALSETLIDSQLFGHERGAFTGAQSRVKGKFELADRGTLFLDEIADLSPQGQSKILRAIEYGEFERLGSETLRQSRRSRACRPRTIPPRHWSGNGMLREDLFYRINGVTILVPPLRASTDRICRHWWRARSLAPARCRASPSLGLDRAAADSVVRVRLAGQPPRALEGRACRRRAHDRIRSSR